MARIPFLYPLVLFFLLLSVSNVVFAQLPSCNAPNGPGNGIIYYLDAGKIWNLDANRPQGPGNPSVNLIRPPFIANGLAVGVNLISGKPRATFYVSTTVGEYYYYNGSQWVTTGHKCRGHSPASTALSIVGFNDSNDFFTRYDGASDAIQLGNHRKFGIEDFEGDCEGNFYAFGTEYPNFFTTREDTFYKYDNNGTLLQELPVYAHDTLFWDTVNNFDKKYGFAILEDRIFVPNQYGLWEGKIFPDSVVFNIPPNYTINPINPYDFATCPIGGVGDVSLDINTVRETACGPQDTVKFYKVGGRTSTVTNWSILGGGPATLIPAMTTDTIYVSASDSVRIRMTVVDTYYCNKPYIFDADLFIPSITMNAGADRHLIGCTPFIDTLEGHLSNTTPNIFYIISWNPQPLFRYLPPNRLKPEITIGSDTFFILTIFTPQHMGGCYWHDTVNVTVEDYREDNIAFDYDIRYGCEQDTILLKNKTTTQYGPLTSKWFADTVLFSTDYDASNIYPNQDTHKVLLVTNNGYCDDSLLKEIDTEHPLDAKFNVAKKVPCVEQLVEYSADSSIVFQYPYGNPTEYHWNFHGYRFTEGKKVGHAFPEADKYNVKLTVIDGIGCRDSIEKVINVFGHMPIMNLGPADTVACDDHELHLPFGGQGRVESYLWQDGSREPTFHVTEPGIIQ